MGATDFVFGIGGYGHLFWFLLLFLCYKVVKWHRWSQALNFAVFYLTKWYKHFEGQDSVSNYNQILSPDSDSDSIEKKYPSLDSDSDSIEIMKPSLDSDSTRLKTSGRAGL